MKNIVKEYIEPSNAQKKELWGKAVFVFDTNVLLNLYRYSAKTRSSLLAAFESFHDRVWIPYQVAYEYMNKRCKVIYETVQRYDQFKNEINNFTSKAVETLRLTSNDEEISDLNRYLFKWLDSNKDRNLLVLSAEEDEILEKILAIFDQRVGLPPTEEELRAIKEEGKNRYKNAIPPGYKDDKKKNESDDNNAYGDLIIWKQIIKYAKDNQVGIIYVTHDQKEDWWNIVKGKTIGPRFELRKEFQDETQQEFHMYSMNSFISTYNKMNKVPIDKSVVQEVINFEKTYNNGTPSKKEPTIPERIARTEGTIEKIQNRLLRREQIIEGIESKYQQKGISLPENIQTQYDNTQEKASELRMILERKERELELLKQSQLPPDNS